MKGGITINSPKTIDDPLVENLDAIDDEESDDLQRE